MTEEEQLAYMRKQWKKWKNKQTSFLDEAIAEEKMEFDVLIIRTSMMNDSYNDVNYVDEEDKTNVVTLEPAE